MKHLINLRINRLRPWFCHFRKTPKQKKLSAHFEYRTKRSLVKPGSEERTKIINHDIGTSKHHFNWAKIRLNVKNNFGILKFRLLKSQNVPDKRKGGQKNQKIRVQFGRPLCTAISKIKSKMTKI